jgi:tRNA(fMet)-specific endonuclease VapC
MIRYLLDTNAVIELLKNTDSSIARLTRKHKPSEIGVSSIVVHELFYGAFKSQRIEQNVELIDRLEFEVLDFDQEDAREAGEIRAVLALTGKPIGPYDVLIAGQAKARNLILITHNVKEFNRVAGLKIQDWSTKLVHGAVT